MPTPRTPSLGYLLIDEASPSVTVSLWASGVLRGALERGLRRLRAGRAHLRAAGSVANAVRFHCRHRRTRRRSAPGAPQVRASPGPAHQERPGGPRPRRGAGAPGRALAPTPACREDTLRVPYQSVTLKSKLSPTPSVGNHVLPPQLETRSSNNGDPPGLCAQPPKFGVPARPHVRWFPKIRAKESTPVVTFTFSANGICNHLG